VKIDNDKTISATKEEKEACILTKSKKTGHINKYMQGESKKQSRYMNREIRESYVNDTEYDGHKMQNMPYGVVRLPNVSETH
jgi:hypothetical protein